MLVVFTATARWRWTEPPPRPSGKENSNSPRLWRGTFVYRGNYGNVKVAIYGMSFFLYLSLPSTLVPPLWIVHRVWCGHSHTRTSLVEKSHGAVDICVGFGLFVVSYDSSFPLVASHSFVKCTHRYSDWLELARISSTRLKLTFIQQVNALASCCTASG